MPVLERLVAHLQATALLRHADTSSPMEASPSSAQVSLDSRPGPEMAALACRGQPRIQIWYQADPHQCNGARTRQLSSAQVSPEYRPVSACHSDWCSGARQMHVGASAGVQRMQRGETSDRVAPACWARRCKVSGPALHAGLHQLSKQPAPADCQWRSCLLVELDQPSMQGI